MVVAPGKIVPFEGPVAIYESDDIKKPAVLTAGFFL